MRDKKDSLYATLMFIQIIIAIPLVGMGILLVLMYILALLVNGGN